jgi:hypothetical protein
MNGALEGKAGNHGVAATPLERAMSRRHEVGERWALRGPEATRERAPDRPPLRHPRRAWAEARSEGEHVQTAGGELLGASERRGWCGSGVGRDAIAVTLSDAIGNLDTEAVSAPSHNCRR